VLGSNDCQVVLAGRCRGSSPPRNTPAETDTVTVAPTPSTPPTPPQFASELGSFHPERPGASIQPGDWSMPRLPTNFIATAGTHTRSGELAGWPIQVRFIPIRYHWSFGDGQRATFSEPGRSWSGWGVRQFQATPTSHIYRRPGTYTAGLRVEYRVEFRFVGQRFQRLSGTVSANGPNQRIRVLTVSPLLLG
jgi:PKD repeat protein